MRRQYDFSDGERNPYASRLRKPVTIRMEEGTIAYFKDMADRIGIPYQTLINLYLRDCALSGLEIDIDWKTGNRR